MAQPKWFYIAAICFWANSLLADIPAKIKLALASRDYDTALVWLNDKADDPEVAYELAKLYRMGKGVKKNMATAARLFEVAAEAENTQAQYLLAKYYQQINKVDQARGWMQKAADSGHKQAKKQLKQLSSVGADLTLAQRLKAKMAPPARSGPDQSNMRDDAGRTLLIIAVEQKAENWVSYLLDTGVNPGLQDKLGNTALHYAVKGEVPELVKLMLKAGASANVRSLDGDTPLHLAIALKQLEVVELLLKSGADAGLENAQGWSSSMLAKRSDDTDIQAALGLEQLQTNQRMNRIAEISDPDSIFMQAAGSGDTELVRSLLSREININSSDASGYTSLAHSVLNGHLEISQLLLRSGAQTAKNFSDNQSLLHLASRSGEPKMLSLVLKNLPDRHKIIDQQDIRQQTALVLAVNSFCIACVSQLLDQQASTRLQDEYGNTPLISALINEQNEIAALLIERGAAADARDNSGRNALWWAVRKGQVKLASALIESTSDVSGDISEVNALHVAAEENHGLLVQMLLDRTDANLKTSSGNTALILAAHEGSTDAIARLLLAGADLEAQNTRGDTALITAVMSGQSETAKLLLEAGANPSVRNQRFESASSLVEQLKDPKWHTLFESHDSVLAKLL